MTQHHNTAEPDLSMQAQAAALEKEATSAEAIAQAEAAAAGRAADDSRAAVARLEEVRGAAEGSKAKTEAQLEKTFVLNFVKKGELKDEIKELKGEIARLEKEIVKGGAAAEKARHRK